MGAKGWLRYEARAQLAPYDRIFLPVARRRPGHRDAVASAQTAVIIEGFARSGNTFAVAAFRLAQVHPVVLASHLHAPAHVRYGVKHAIPTLVVVRSPIDVAVSVIIRHPGLSPAQVLRHYVDFHRRLRPLRDGFVLATFDEVTTDFGRTIRRLNERFNTSFRSFEHTPENVDAVFDLVERMNEEDLTRRSEAAEDGVARPSRSRASRKNELLEQLASPALRARVAAAEEAYAEIVGETPR